MEFQQTLSDFKGWINPIRNKSKEGMPQGIKNHVNKTKMVPYVSVNLAHCVCYLLIWRFPQSW